MPLNITDADTFEDPVVAPATNDAANQATFVAGLQDLANRTRYLYNRIGTIPTLSANRILARASTGATEGKPSTDFTLSMVALGTAVAWHDALHAKGANIAAAGSTNIAGATGRLVHITGVGTITAFGTAAAGVERVIVFDASGGVLTHNATSLILPYARNITYLAGDSALVVSEGGGNWRVVAYKRALAEHADGADYNAFYGYAGNATHSGTGNNGLGIATLDALTTGDANNGFGRGALSAVTTGNDNIGLGDNVGGTLQTGSSNILIGSDVDVPAANTDNFLSIADVLFGDLSAGVLRVGGSGVVTQDASEVLQIAGNAAFPADVLSPVIYQIDAPSGTGQRLSVLGQNAPTKGGQIVVEAGAGSTVTTGEGGWLYLRGGSGDAGDGSVYINAGDGDDLSEVKGDVVIGGNGDVYVASDTVGAGLLFFADRGNGTPATKQTVSGSTIDGTALQSLLNALSAYGLINDVTNDS